MSDTKKISISAIDRVIKEKHEANKSVVWNGLEFTVKRTLGLKETLAFVDKIVSACFMDETNEYLPEVEDFAVRCAVVESYSDVRLPDSIEHKHKILYCTDLYIVILSNIDNVQFNELLSAARNKIGRIADANISALQKEVSLAAKMVSDTAEKIASLFDGIDEGDIQKVIRSIGESEPIDEEKIVRIITEKDAEDGVGDEK